jgi:hypothetical protein
MSQNSLYISAKHWISFAILSIILLCSTISTAKPPETDDSKRGEESKQIIWWHEDELIKSALVSAIALKMDHLELQNEAEFRDHFSDVIDLLLLFDTMESDRALETLASLRSYYFGSHGGETYSCLLQRKGKKIKPILTRMLNSKENECHAKFKGLPVVEASGSKVRVCLSDYIYRIKLKAIIGRIENNEWCTIE